MGAASNTEGRRPTECKPQRLVNSSMRSPAKCRRSLTPKQQAISKPFEKQRESEAPAELAPPWFGRSLTLPSNELVGQGRCEHI